MSSGINNGVSVLARERRIRRVRQRCTPPTSSALVATDMFLHNMIASWISDVFGNVIAPMSGKVLMLLIATFALNLSMQAAAREERQSGVQSEILLRTNFSWDGEPYKSYPFNQPELSILRIILAPHTELEWHSHPIPSAAYIVAGELTVERKKDGKKRHFIAGQAISETVDKLHRGVAGDEPVVLIVFYAGSPGVLLTHYPRH
jgi:quercetin dioxygenase-like cupin family protein